MINCSSKIRIPENECCGLGREWKVIGMIKIEDFDRQRSKNNKRMFKRKKL